MGAGFNRFSVPVLFLRKEKAESHQKGGILQPCRDIPDDLTRVQADAYPDRYVWHMAHLESANGTEDIEGHVGDFTRVSVPVPFRQPGSHHVGVANGLHLSVRTGVVKTAERS